MDAPVERPTVILVAEHASAVYGGEAMLPLHYFRLLRKRGVDAHLVVHDRTRDELLALLPEEAERIHFVQDLAVQRTLWSWAEKLPTRIGENSLGFALHLLTQARERRLVRRLVKRYRAHLVHEPSPVSPKLPSMIFDVGAPVVIGPMNGGMSYPPGFEALENPAERWFVEAARKLAPILHRLIPGKRRASMLLVANPRTRRALPAGAAPRVREMVENGVDLSLFRPASQQKKRPKGGPCRFVYLGRLVDWKGVDILLDAFARAREQAPMTLDIVGDGDERAVLELRARVLGIDDAVTFHGFLPQEECPRLLAECDCLALSSLYECGGAVVLEAMAMGLPAIATRWGGPADYLDDETGRLVDPTGGRESFTDRFVDAMVELAKSPRLRRKLGAAGHRRVRQAYDWQRKVDEILRVYEEARLG